jgi:hypothetical protein
MPDRSRIVGLITAALVLSVAANALAQTPIDWTSIEPLTGVVEEGELFVDVDTAAVYPLLVVAEPGVQPPRFEIDGTIRHEDVTGIAYLEMYTVLPDGSRYFTRTLAESGPLGYMTGSSEQRQFSLPFELGEGGPIPTSLEINLVTEGPGRFWVGPLTIVSAVGQQATTTTTTQGAITTLSVSSGTTVAAFDDEEVFGTGWWWGLAAVVVAGAFAGFVWSSSVRRRRAQEQRKMDAMDSLR